MTIAGNLDWKRVKIFGVEHFPGGTGNEQRLQQWVEELEKVGVTENLRKALWFICREEIPNQLGEETPHARGLTAARVEDFGLKILNPRENEEGRLRVFRHSAREGRVVADRCLHYDLWWVPKV